VQPRTDQSHAARPGIVSAQRPVMIMTMGDPAGIGPDTALEAWRQRRERNLPAFALIADIGMLRERAHQLGYQLALEQIGAPREALAVFSRALPVLPVNLRAGVRPGQPDTANAAAVISAIEIAVASVKSGAADAIVTSPVAKDVLYRAGFNHPGHTEFLADLARHHWPGLTCQPVMMLASAELKVVPTTIHIALQQVPAALNAKLIVATGRTLAHSLKNDFGIQTPHIAVCGLNPHAGENATMGAEDRDVIAPAIEDLRALGVDATGPHPGDTLFHASARATYDAVLAMYHDQALIPIKTLAFETAVNATLGLPFVRTSPDHGTAFAIAGSGKASPESLIAALKLAEQIAARRRLTAQGVQQQ